MRQFLIVATLLAATTAFGANIYENSMDGYVDAGWQCTVNSITEGERTFARVTDFNPESGWWYFNTYTGEIDISGGATFEADVRWHQQGSTAYQNAWAQLRIGTPDGSYFYDPFFQVGVQPTGSVGDEWYHISVNLSDAVGTIDLTQFDGFEFMASFDDDDYTGDYFDVDNVVITPEPASLGLLALAGLLFRRR